MLKERVFCGIWEGMKTVELYARVRRAVLVEGVLRAKPLFPHVRLHVEVEVCAKRERLFSDVVGARQRTQARYGILSGAI